ncbi:MAG: hypothetical protein N4A33_05950 [Bacteriovoracaceae bacterium]|jgi:hypothetical protein|nr:hypothetical protein [Bacteriovoracaceae bacterium]
MKTLIAIALTSLFSFNLFACAGGTIQLNDIKSVNSYAMYDSSQEGSSYPFIDDLNDGLSTYNISNSRGILTHSITLFIDIQDRLIVSIYNKSTEVEKSYIGSRSLSRGCNELIPLNK